VDGLIRHLWTNPKRQINNNDSWIYLLFSLFKEILMPVGVFYFSIYFGKNHTFRVFKKFADSCESSDKDKVFPVGHLK